MPSSGSGQMTPVSGGPGTGLSVAQPLPYTLLSLGRYAQIMGITPPHFFMAHAPNSVPSPVWPISTCGGVWPRHAWQNYEQASLEDIAIAINNAETELAAAVGYWAAPTWISDEIHPYPRDFYPESLHQVLDLRGYGKGLTVRKGRILSQGRRAVTLLGTVNVAGGSLAYTDEDSDGFYETATVTVAGITATTDVCKIKVYFTGQGGVREWEIRPPRSKTLVGGVFTGIFPSWLFIDPDLQSVYPTEAGFAAIDISTVANFVTSAEVYYEYNDTTATTAQFDWEPAGVTSGICSCCGGSGCEVCSLTSQNGCAHVRDARTGILVPAPATYDAVNGWTGAVYSVCRAPQQVHFWYYAGEQAQEFLEGRTCDPLSNFWAQTIAWLATARLGQPPCSCAGVRSRFNYLQEDLSKAESGLSYFAGQDVTANPFGSMRGEVLVWRRIKHMIPKRMVGVAI